MLDILRRTVGAGPHFFRLISDNLRSITMNSYVRNRYVSEFAKKRANGICQLCGKPAPFETRNGEPYLEAHHIIPLANEGTDSIDNIAALCPNCHRKMHSLSLDRDIQFLLGVVSKI